MRFLTKALAATVAAALPAENLLAARASGSLDSFLSSETPIALQGVLNNFGPSGSKAQGTRAGQVVASPSTANPDCMYSFLPRNYAHLTVAKTTTYGRETQL